MTLVEIKPPKETFEEQLIALSIICKEIIHRCLIGAKCLHLAKCLIVWTAVEKAIIQLKAQLHKQEYKTASLMLNYWGVP